MRRALKWAGIVLGALVGLVLVLAAVSYFVGESRLNKQYDIPPSNISLPTDAASLEAGKHRVETLCQGCHGEDLGGIDGFFSAPSIGNIDSANLTAGEGGIGDEFTTEDYVRAIRHGINREGKPIFMTAVSSTAYLSDEDLGAIIAYLKTIPPVDRELQPTSFTPLSKIMFAAGLFGKLPAETVSHDVHVTAPPRGVSTEYGEYLVNTHDCRICHGQELSGGPFPDPTIQKISPNLTPGGELAFWTEEEFIDTIRTGTTPSGHQLDSEFMPWQVYAQFFDEELKAIWLYLQSLPEMPQYTE